MWEGSSSFTLYESFHNIHLFAYLADPTPLQQNPAMTILPHKKGNLVMKDPPGTIQRSAMRMKIANHILQATVMLTEMMLMIMKRKSN